MNKDKIAKAKQKLKDRAPEIIAFALTATALVGGVYAVKKSLHPEVFSMDTDFRLEEVAGKEREALMKDKDFKLLKLTDDEYMFAREVTE